MKLDTLEIRILLKCSEGLLKRNYVSQLYKKYTAAQRTTAINRLIKNGFIKAKEFPKPGAKITPVFYEITEQGRKWVKEYLENYPE